MKIHRFYQRGKLAFLLFVEEIQSYARLSNYSNAVWSRNRYLSSLLSVDSFIESCRGHRVAKVLIAIQSAHGWPQWNCPHEYGRGVLGALKAPKSMGAGRATSPCWRVSGAITLTGECMTAKGLRVIDRRNGLLVRMTALLAEAWNWSGIGAVPATGAREN